MAKDAKTKKWLLGKDQIQDMVRKTSSRDNKEYACKILC
jgi:hypothetical protein